MEVIYLDEKVDFSKERTVIGLGNFDGFHKGHIHLLKEIKNISKKNALISSLLIFRTHTDEIFNKKDYKYLSFLSDKFEILKNFGIDKVFMFLMIVFYSCMLFAENADDNNASTLFRHKTQGGQSIFHTLIEIGRASCRERV